MPLIHRHAARALVVLASSGMFAAAAPVVAPAGAKTRHCVKYKTYKKHGKKYRRCSKYRTR